MDDPAAVGLGGEAAGLLDVSEVGALALVGVGVGAGADEVPLQLTTARPRKTTVIPRKESASLAALFRAI